MFESEKGAATFERPRPPRLRADSRPVITPQAATWYFAGGTT